MNIGDIGFLIFVALLFLGYAIKGHLRRPSVLKGGLSMTFDNPANYQHGTVLVKVTPVRAYDVTFIREDGHVITKHILHSDRDVEDWCRVHALANPPYPKEIQFEYEEVPANG